jgi:hypothetical protein
LASCVLILMARVLDELQLGLLEAFGLALAGLGQRTLRLVGLVVSRLFGGGFAAYPGGFGGGQIGLF